jgi:gliding motility-associated-like protein
MVESEYIESFKCIIMDRNQKLIFEWSNIYGHWNGQDMSGNDVPNGAYFYIIEASDKDGNALPLKKGFITLSR